MTTPTYPDLQALRDQTVALSTALPGPLARLRVQLGDAAVDVEWASAAAVAPTPPPAGAAAYRVAGDVADDEPAGDRDRAPDGGGAQPQRPDAAVTITAGLVGAFYRAPRPGAAPYVEVGATVETGQQVACLEAMKLLMPVEATCAGTVTAVLAEDGELVAFGQPLVRIEPAR